MVEYLEFKNSHNLSAKGCKKQIYKKNNII